MRMQSALLVSDMSAFKAANPGACLEDFVRWHSPTDWKPNGHTPPPPPPAAAPSKAQRPASAAAAGDAPTGGVLSARMASSEPDNAWRRLWQAAPAVPATAQRPLLDPRREGEAALHYLDTLGPR